MTWHDASLIMCGKGKVDGVQLCQAAVHVGNSRCGSRWRCQPWKVLEAADNAAIGQAFEVGASHVGDKGCIGAKVRSAGQGWELVRTSTIGMKLG